MSRKQHFHLGAGLPTTPQEAVAAGVVTPTSKADMGGFEGPKCHNCGSFNTDLAGDGGHDCYDCGHTSYKKSAK